MMVTYAQPTKKAAIEAVIQIAREKREAIEKAIPQFEDANPGLTPKDVIYTAA